MEKTMIALKYVGLKLDGERAFQQETGIEWFPGSRHEVTAAMAAKMLKHPDVFAEDDEPAKAANPVTKPQSEDAALKEVIATLAPVADAGTSAAGLDSLDRAGLHALAKELGVKVHHNAGAETVRTAIEAAQK
jgi:hypothetical protein